jgi:hypothetical protein
VTNVGDHKNFDFTGIDADGEPVDITGHTIIFKAFDSAGNAIDKTQDDGIVLQTQSGATLGMAVVQITPLDYPAAWLALKPGQRKKLRLEIVHIDGDGIVHTTKSEWVVEGQAITVDFQIFDDTYGDSFE